MKNASKSYKMEISKAYELYQRNIGNKLRQTKKSDSKKFWNILNSIGSNKKKKA